MTPLVTDSVLVYWPHSHGHIRVDVDAATEARWREACDAFWTVQREMQKAVDAAREKKE